MFVVKGCVALITGGASGIGLGIARELLLRDAKGVAIVDINDVGKDHVEEMLKEFGPNRAIFVKTDVVDAKQLKDAFETTVKAFDQLDVVFNNAGIFDELNWEKCFDINLIACVRGTMIAAGEYLPKYAKKIDPIVVNTASTAAYQIFPPLPIYSASKGGIVSFTRSFGSSFDISKVRVIAICPGPTETPIFRNCPDRVQECHREMLQDIISAITPQSIKVLASLVMSLLETAPSGTIWEIEDGNLKKINL